MTRQRTLHQNRDVSACPGIIIAVTCLLAIRCALLRWQELYSGLYTELGKLIIDASLFINLPPVEWGKDKGKISSRDPAR